MEILFSLICKHDNMFLCVCESHLLQPCQSLWLFTFFTEIHQGGARARVSPGGSDGKERIYRQCERPRFRSLDQEDPLEKGIATQPSILAWTEEPGMLQSMGWPSWTGLSDKRFLAGRQLPGQVSELHLCAGWWLRGKASACNAGDPGLIPGFRNIPWKRRWQPTPVLLPGKFHGLQCTGSQRVGRD